MNSSQLVLLILEVQEDWQSDNKGRRCFLKLLIQDLVDESILLAVMA